MYVAMIRDSQGDTWSTHPMPTTGQAIWHLVCWMNEIGIEYRSDRIVVSPADEVCAWPADCACGWCRLSTLAANS